MISQMHWRGLQLVAACEIKKVFNVRNHHESLCKWNVSGMWLSKLRLHVVVVHSINDASFVVDHYCRAAAILAGEILGCQAGLQVQIHSLSSEIPGPQNHHASLRSLSIINALSDYQLNCKYIGLTRIRKSVARAQQLHTSELVGLHIPAHP